MADFFGGILDSVSSVGDDVQGFFNSSIGQAVAKGVSGAYGDKKQKELKWNEGFMGQKEYDSFNAGKADQAPTSKDFHEVERQWLIRMKKFAGLSDDTAVKLGAK